MAAVSDSGAVDVGFGDGGTSETSRMVEISITSVAGNPAMDWFINSISGRTWGCRGMFSFVSAGGGPGAHGYGRAGPPAQLYSLVGITSIRFMSMKRAQLSIIAFRLALYFASSPTAS